MMFELWDDAKGEVIFTGTEDAVKARYMEELDRNVIAEMNLFIEAPDGSQYAWNRNINPPDWEEI